MDEPRRLTRSTGNKYVAGVAGGLGRYFGLDPVLFRIAFGVSIVFGGVGIFAYIALWVFLPTDAGEPSFMDNRSRATSLLVMALLVVAAFSVIRSPGFLLGPGLLGVAVLGVAAVLIYRAFSGEVREDPARAIARATLVLLGAAAALGAATGIGFLAAIGGGTAEAIIAIFAGLTLIAAGLLGGPRWLMLPVVVLLLPLGVVTAAGIDLRGGVGHRDFRPATVADLRPEYRIGAGDLDLDLSRVKLPAGRTNVKLVVGVGAAKVYPPDGACVTTDASIGAGATDVPNRHEQGFDVAVADAATPREGRPLLHVQADVGIGYLKIEPRDFGACA